jgi:hypothetical protein
MNITKTKVSLDQIGKTILLLGITDTPPFQDDSEILWYLTKDKTIRIVDDQENDSFVSLYQKNGDVVSQTRSKNCLDIVKHVARYFHTVNTKEGEITHE